jgi:hypothetical protein
MVTYLQYEISSDHKDPDSYLYTQSIQKTNSDELVLERLSHSFSTIILCGPG